MHKPVRQLDLIKYYGWSIILGNLSNYDGDANENVTQKTNFTLGNGLNPGVSVVRVVWSSGWV